MSPSGMSPGAQRLSVPATGHLPRALTPTERSTFVRIADILCPGDELIASPSAQPGFAAELDIALAARSDAFDTVVTHLNVAADIDDLPTWARDLHDSDPHAFQIVSTVAAGAFLLLPAVRAALGYPGQPRSVAPVDQAADEIGDGILDPVLERGHFYVPTVTPG